MSHMIDQTTGADAIAYVGQEPWHGLGARLQPGQDIDTWRRAAHLDWSVEASPAFYLVPGESVCRAIPNRKTLYRSDTKAALATMSENFHPVQPAQVLDLYAEIAKAGGFELETAGVLDEGRRIWALARVSDGAYIVNKDRVRPYVLLATSYDGSMATVAKYTAIRVVCHNTISMAIPQRDGAGSATERDETAAGKEQIVRVMHSTKWTEDVAKNVRLQLGVAHDAFEKFLIETRALAGQQMKPEESDAFIAMLIEPYTDMEDVRESRGFKVIKGLFEGGAIGADMAGERTKWAMLNAVTEFVDHQRGKNVANRLEAAWFGTGNAIKNRAKELLAA